VTDATALAPTGALRASINLGNPVLAQGTPQEPRGITVDLARELAVQLGVPLQLLCFTAARDCFAALVDGRADVGFLAIEPAREEEVAFTAPYVVIEGVYVVPDDSPVATAADVDRPGIRIGVKRGSAYDLFLTRTLQHAELVRGEEGVEVYLAEGLEVGAGIRQPASAWVAAHPGQRLVEPRFMEVRQAVATPHRAAVGELAAFVDELVASGWVAERTRS
jgi:polar amino acid transport system substrate-binding protein